MLRTIAHLMVYVSVVAGCSDCPRGDESVTLTVFDVDSGSGELNRSGFATAASVSDDTVRLQLDDGVELEVSGTPSPALLFEDGARYFVHAEARMPFWSEGLITAWRSEDSEITEFSGSIWTGRLFDRRATDAFTVDYQPAGCISEGGCADRELYDLVIAWGAERETIAPGTSAQVAGYRIVNDEGSGDVDGRARCTDVPSVWRAGAILPE